MVNIFSTVYLIIPVFHGLSRIPLFPSCGLSFLGLDHLHCPVFSLGRLNQCKVVFYYFRLFFFLLFIGLDGVFVVVVCFFKSSLRPELARKPVSEGRS